MSAPATTNLGQRKIAIPRLPKSDAWQGTIKDRRRVPRACTAVSVVELHKQPDIAKYTRSTSINLFGEEEAFILHTYTHSYMHTSDFARSNSVVHTRLNVPEKSLDVGIAQQRIVSAFTLCLGRTDSKCKSGKEHSSFPPH
jgi:hypothetical protein